jgi:pyruvate kinase
MNCSRACSMQLLLAGCSPPSVASGFGVWLGLRSHPVRLAAPGRRARPATIACTLPAALAQARKGDRIWFDDGRIGGVVLHGGASRVEVEVTEARDGGERLAADKGINLPDTRLQLPALTAKDLDDLAVVAQHADIVGLSFAQSADDVHLLRQKAWDLPSTTSA